MNGIEKSLGRIEQKLDDVKELVQTQTTRLNDHAKRVDSLERTRDRYWGGLKVASAVIVFLGGLGGWFTLR